MSELDTILQKCAGQAAPGGVLATVVHVRGSSYRRPGARMLLSPDRRRIGCISGGCLEGDVSNKAFWLTQTGPCVRTYDTRSEDGEAFEFGLGCNGVIDILLERTDSVACQALLAHLGACRRERRAAVVATVIRANHGGTHVGDRLFLSASGIDEASLAGTPFTASVVAQAVEVLETEQSRLMIVDACEIFIEWVPPPVSLVIFGAGHDSIPLAGLAREIGWQVTIANPRATDFEANHLADSLTLDTDTIAVLMTHSYPRDLEILKRLAPVRPRYIGILGPQTRTQRLLAEAGLAAKPEIHGPAGLDLGADSPETIALSILAEIQAVLTKRDGSMLRFRAAPIYAQPAEVAIS